MHFDDRLSTVLRAPPAGTAAARTQYRQLVDLIGTMPSAARGEEMDKAWVRLAELSAMLTPTDRVAALGEPGLRLRNPRLVAELCRTEPALAAAAIRVARLREEAWLDLMPALPAAALGAIRQRSDLTPRVADLCQRLGLAPIGLPAAGNGSQIAANDEQAPPLPQPSEGIGAIVQRIEAYRKRRANMAGIGAAPAPAPEVQHSLPLPPARPLESISFICDESGRIVWADQLAATPTLGLQIAARDEASPARSAPEVVADFHRRRPIRGGALHIAGAATVAGNWQVDAAPRFDKLGRFTGYAGRLRRAPQAAPAEASGGEADRLRQLLHELRTPVNAIQGFAEVIQQQLFGPTPHAYRAHAAAIAGDAARMLAAFDELERLAKLETGAIALETGESDLAATIGELAAQINAHLESRQAGFDVAPVHATPVGLAHDEVERLAWRLLAALAGVIAPRERLRLALSRDDTTVRLVLPLPSALATQDDVFHAAVPSGASSISASMFGIGFALRLAASEAKAAGGSLSRQGDALHLELPGPGQAPAMAQASGGKPN